MKSEKEIREKLTKLLDVKKVRSHKPETCPTCGQTMPIDGTWWLPDYAYLDAEIDSLKWVLGEAKHLMENHT